MSYQSYYPGSSLRKPLYPDHNQLTPTHIPNRNRPSSLHNSLSKIDLNTLLEEAKATKVLKLNEFLLGDEGAQKLAAFLSKQNNIEVIELKGNNISSDGFGAICDGSLNNQHIRVIGAEWNNIGSGLRGLEALCELLAQNNSLEILGKKTVFL